MKVRSMKLEQASKPAPEATPAKERENPHCAPQWPYYAHIPGEIHGLHKALAGANTLARLIHADLNLAEDRRMDDDPESLPAPFTQDVAFGLRMALIVCLDEATAQIEHMESMGSRKAGDTP